MTISVLKDLTSCHCSHMKIIAFFNHLSHFHILFWHFFRHNELIFYIIIVLFPAAKFLHVARIIRVVIEGCHSSELVKTICQHSLWVHISKPKRPNDVVHTMGFAIISYRIKQCTAHFYVVNKVYPAKPYSLCIPLFVCFVVNDGSHTAHQLAFFIS